jgi:hypothetical protein
MLILGMNAFHGDSAAEPARDGRLVAPVEEERFRRLAGSSIGPGFPRCVKPGCASLDTPQGALRRTDKIRLMGWPAPITVFFYTPFRKGLPV